MGNFPFVGIKEFSADVAPWGVYDVYESMEYIHSGSFDRIGIIILKSKPIRQDYRINMIIIKSKAIRQDYRINMIILKSKPIRQD